MYDIPYRTPEQENKFSDVIFRQKVLEWEMQKFLNIFFDFKANLFWKKYCFEAKWTSKTRICDDTKNK